VTKKILVLEPDDAILRLIEILLADEEYSVVSDYGENSRDKDGDFDLVLIDIALPYEKRLGTLALIRDSETVPIIAMSAATSQEVIHAAVQRGANDFMALPFDPDDLVSHIRFLLGEQTEVPTNRKPLVSGSVEVDFRYRSIRLDGDTVILSHSEWTVLECLASPPGQPCLTAELLSRTWGAALRNDHEFLRMSVERLQRKLGCDPRHPRLIKPYHDVGYLLAP
jgi:OmpR family response regulator RpaB